MSEHLQIHTLLSAVHSGESAPLHTHCKDTRDIIDWELHTLFKLCFVLQTQYAKIETCLLLSFLLRMKQMEANSRHERLVTVAHMLHNLEHAPKVVAICWRL